MLEVQNFFKKQLEEEIKVFEDWNIQGVRSFSEIYEQIEEKALFAPEVVIIRNSQIELVFFKKTQQIEFRTTHSNQLIDKDYMDMILRISQVQASIGSLIKSIIYYTNKED